MKVHRPYQLKEYDSAWEKKFSEKAQRLRAVLKDEVVAIHHVGSTSIPGMAAKPQIDVVVVVRDLSKIPSYYGPMKEEGFVALGDFTGIGEEYFVEDATDTTRVTSVHVVPVGHLEIEEQLRFRNYLRQNEANRKLYSLTKQKLYKTYQDNYPAYGKEKGEVIAVIKKRAREWAKKYHGVIIEESLENKDVLKKVKIVSTKVEPVTDDHETPWLSQWTLHTVEVPESEAQGIAEEISRALEQEHPWYADFKNDTHHYVIFRGKVFCVERANKEQYDDVVRYGLSLGIPEYQLDFSPKVGEWER